MPRGRANHMPGPCHRPGGMTSSGQGNAVTNGITAPVARCNRVTMMFIGVGAMIVLGMSACLITGLILAAAGLLFGIERSRRDPPQRVF